MTFQRGNKCTVLDAALSVVTTCDLEELSDSRLALPLQVISHRRKLSGKGLLGVCSVLQDVPVILADLFHGGVVVRSEESSACGAIGLRSGLCQRRAGCGHTGGLKGPLGEAGAHIGCNPKQDRTCRSKDGQLRHDIGKRVDAWAAADEDCVNLVPHHGHSA